VGGVPVGPIFASPTISFAISVVYQRLIAGWESLHVLVIGARLLSARFSSSASAAIWSVATMAPTTMLFGLGAGRAHARRAVAL